MTEQEEIREGIAVILYDLLGGDSEFDKEGGCFPMADFCDKEADKILAYLHSQDVVIKKTQKYPLLPYFIYEPLMEEK